MERFESVEIHIFDETGIKLARPPLIYHVDHTMSSFNDEEFKEAWCLGRDNYTIMLSDCETYIKSHLEKVDEMDRDQLFALAAFVKGAANHFEDQPKPDLRLRPYFYQIGKIMEERYGI
jgi:hypothetical protein